MTAGIKKTRVQLHEPERAIDDYLAALLAEVKSDYDEPAAAMAETLEQLQVDSPEPVADMDSAIIPAWAEQPFQCLLFKVRGLSLAIPLVALNSIAEWDGELTRIPGQPDWHLGVLLHRERHIVVVDTARLIMPERLGPSQVKAGDRVLVIGDGSRGLVCDSLHRPITLEKSDVRWRSSKGVRPWMAGTVIEKLCVLLDVDALLEMVGHE